MRKSSKIEWTEATWNPTVGCDKVSAGCKNCYAETMARRLQAMGTPGYEEGFKFQMLPARLNYPYSVSKPTTFFVNSMSDLFHEQCDYSFIDRVFEVIVNTPQHIYQILTKREKVLWNYFRDKTAPNNCWIGVSVESKTFQHRITALQATNITNRFLSLEPLIGPLEEMNLDGISWVIVGGESGHRARPMKEEWALDIKRQCEEQDVPFFFKQWGTFGEDGVKRSKKANGRKLAGKLYNSQPQLKSLI